MPGINTTLGYIEHDGCYLMLHRVKKVNDLNHDKWIGIGGKFEDKESPEDCMLRETLEETGLTAQKFFELNEQENLRCITGGRCTGITETAVTYLDAAGDSHAIPADSAVLCVGFRSKTALAESLILPGIPYTIIGDGKRVGTVQQAIRDAFDVGMTL